MGFGDLLNKITGGTLSPTPAQPTPVAAQPMAATPVMPGSPVPDPALPSQPAPVATSSTPDPAPVVQPTETATPTMPDPVMPSADPLPEPTTTEPIAAIPEPAQTEPLSQEMPIETAPPATDAPMQVPASESTTNTESTPSLDVLKVTAFDALDTLSGMTAETPEISQIRKPYEEALTQIGNSHDNASFTTLFDLLLTHVEAELYNFSAFQTIAEHPSTLEATVSALVKLVSNNPTIIPQEYIPALSEIEIALENLKNQGKEIEAYNTFTAAYS